MKILNKQDILEIIEQAEPKKLIQCIEEAFISYSNGTANIPPVGYLGFDEPPADIHIKYGHIKNDPYYVIKIASGFYQNPSIGLPSSNGMMLAFDARTGEPKCVLCDEGYLTDLRTALAGAVAAKYIAPGNVECIGIVGTGIQARFQLHYLTLVTDCKKVLVYGRNPERSSSYKQEMEKEGFDVTIAKEITEITDKCNLIVTTTPSTTPLLHADQIRPGTHITAMGSDTEEKQELDAEILKKADLVACDSIPQCSKHGESFHALNIGLGKGSLTEIGKFIIEPFKRTKEMVTVADLTGIATQDIKMASSICSVISTPTVPWPAII